MPFTNYIIGGLAITVGLGAAFTGTWMHGKSVGVTIERAKWEAANVETLTENNAALKTYQDAQEREFNRLKGIEAQAAQDTGEEQVRIVTQIREVPVEKVIRVGGDCRIDHGLVELRNDWAKGGIQRDIGAAFAGTDISSRQSDVMPDGAGAD